MGGSEAAGPRGETRHVRSSVNMFVFSIQVSAAEIVVGRLVLPSIVQLHGNIKKKMFSVFFSYIDFQLK